jgi:PAS domain S-box-containing protein
MRLDPRTAVTIGVLLLLVFTVFAAAIWWTRRRYPGYSRWTLAGLLLLLSLFLLSLRPNAPDWISIVSANALLVLASILYLEGAREFRGLPPRVWLSYAGGAVVIGTLAFFRYVVPNLNARAAVMSTFLGVVSLLVSLTLLRGIPRAHTFGLRLTGSIFALCAATNIVRAVYCAFGPPIGDLFALSGANGAFFLGIAAQMTLFSVGFILLADERVVSDLMEAKERVRRADAEVAQRREAEAVLRESERQFRILANAAPVMIWMSGPDKLCTYFNQGWLDLTGRSIEAELGNGWVEGVHADDVEGCLATYTKAFDAREPFQMQYRLRRHDGAYRWILDHGVPRFSVDGSFDGYVGSAIDVTERKLAEEALSTVSQKLIAAQEDERAWVARELHDDINQRLALLAVTLESLRQDLPLWAGELRGRVEEVHKHIGDLGHDVQELSHRLHSSKLKILGLTTAAKALCRDLSLQYRVEIDMHAETIPHNLRQEVSLCLFRVLQEAVQNAIKHSGSRHVQVSLQSGSHDVELTVQDAGIGFDPAEAITGRGLGLTSMGERLKLVHGHLSIASTPRQGTTIHARVPISPRMTAGRGQDKSPPSRSQGREPAASQ